MIHLGGKEQLGEDTNDRERGRSYAGRKSRQPSPPSLCAFRSLQQVQRASRSVDTLENTDSVMIFEIMRVGVGSNSELIGDELAATRLISISDEYVANVFSVIAGIRRFEVTERLLKLKQDRGHRRRTRGVSSVDSVSSKTCTMGRLNSKRFKLLAFISQE